VTIEESCGQPGTSERISGPSRVATDSELARRGVGLSVLAIYWLSHVERVDEGMSEHFERIVPVGQMIENEPL